MNASAKLIIDFLGGFLGESKVFDKFSLRALFGYHGVGLEVVVLLVALIPSAAGIQITQNGSVATTPLNCQPGVRNQYPVNATPGQRVVIVTTVTSACVGLSLGISQIIVNILPPNSSDILSTAPASPAINTVTAPARAGAWTLIVQVFWNDYPTAGNLEEFQTAITIKILK